MPDAAFTALGITAGVLTLVAAVSYIRSTIRGETKPERGAFIIWGITGTIALFAYWADGAEDSLWLVVGDFIVAITMVLLALKFGYGWHLRRHAAAFLVAGLGLALWAITDQPFLALLCSAAIDAVGVVLVMLKSYEAPWTEEYGPWAMYVAAGTLSFVAVGKLDASLLFYPAYITISTVCIIVAIFLGRIKHPTPPKAERVSILEERIP